MEFAKMVMDGQDGRDDFIKGNLTFSAIDKFPIVQSLLAMENANDNDLIKAIAPLCEKYPELFIAGALAYALGKMCYWSNRDVRVNEERLAQLLQQHIEHHHAQMEVLSLMKRELVVLHVDVLSSTTSIRDLASLN
ncbi:hypothetical protein LguiA_016904 [Lonicera macranthoides]